MPGESENRVPPQENQPRDHEAERQQIEYELVDVENYIITIREMVAAGSITTKAELQELIKDLIGPLQKNVTTQLVSYGLVTKRGIEWSTLNERLATLNKERDAILNSFDASGVSAEVTSSVQPISESVPQSSNTTELSIEERISNINLHPKIAQRIERLIETIQTQTLDPQFDPRLPYQRSKSVSEALSKASDDFLDYFKNQQLDEDTFMLVSELKRKITKDLSDLQAKISQRIKELDSQSILGWRNENGGAIGQLLDSIYDPDLTKRVVELAKRDSNDPDKKTLISELEDKLHKLNAVILDSEDPANEKKESLINNARTKIEGFIQQMQHSVEATHHKDDEEVQKIKDLLQKLESQSTFAVDAHHNEIDHHHHEVLHLFDHFSQHSPNEGLKKELKDKIAITFYKIYRRIYLLQMDTAERQNSTPDYGHVIEPKFFDKMQNLVEGWVGVKYETIEELQKMAKREQNELSYVDFTSNVDQARVLQDFEDLRSNYIGRKFLRLSWNHMAPVGLGAESRNYPKEMTEDHNPVVFVMDRLLNKGLRTPELGSVSNPVLEPNRESEVISFQDTDAKEAVRYDATVFGETFRALDNWVLHKVKFYEEDGKELRPARIHLAIDLLGSEVTEYLKDKFSKKGIDPNIIKDTDVLRAVRAWAVSTYHYSARALSSAEGSDSIYYRHKFVDYNASYVMAGTDSWYPLVTQMLFTIRDERGKKINPLEFIWGDDVKVKEKAPLLQRVMSGVVPQGFDNLKRVMKEKGYTDPNSRDAQKRFESNYLRTYEFLLSPLLTVTEYGQSVHWVELAPGEKISKVGGGVYTNTTDNYERVFVDNNRQLIPQGSEPIPAAEQFTLQPLLASLFFRNPNGEAKRYPSKYKDGNLVSLGKPVSFMDYQDEYGQIIYEKLPWASNATNINSVLNSLQRNGGYFLDNFLKSTKIISALQDPTEVSNFKNNFKYVAMHLPGIGIDISSGIPKEFIDQWPELRYAPQILMNMLIAQLVFVVCIIKSDPAEKDHWGMGQIHEYLVSLVNRSKAIDKYTMHAIYDAIKAAGSVQISTSNLSRQFYKALKDRFKYD